MRCKQYLARTASVAGWSGKTALGKLKDAGQAASKEHRLFTHFSGHTQLITMHLSGSV